MPLPTRRTEFRAASITAEEVEPNRFFAALPNPSATIAGSFNSHLPLEAALTARTRSIPQQSRIQDTVRLSAEGIAKILGDLEARVMHAVWDLNQPVPARTVHDHVYPDHPVALHTVITVLNKLVRKGLLTRQKQSDLLHYQPTVSENEFRKRESRRVVEGILPLSEGAITASLVDILAERDPKHLTRLMEMIELRLLEDRN